jgi:predicted secreted protein
MAFQKGIEMLVSIGSVTSPDLIGTMTNIGWNGSGEVILNGEWTIPSGDSVTISSAATGGTITHTIGAVTGDIWITGDVLTATSGSFKVTIDSIDSATFSAAGHIFDRTITGVTAGATIAFDPAGTTDDITFSIDDIMVAPTLQIIGGATSKSIAITKESIEVSGLVVDGSGDANEWIERSARGLRSVTSSMSGIFYDTAGEATLRSAVDDTTSDRWWKITVPGLMDMYGKFVVGSIEYNGETSGGVSFSASIESNEDIEFVNL